MSVGPEKSRRPFSFTCGCQMPTEVISNRRMWGHTGSCHHSCCGYCSCGYTCLKYSEEEVKTGVEMLKRLGLDKLILKSSERTRHGHH